MIAARLSIGTIRRWQINTIAAERLEQLPGGLNL